MGKQINQPGSPCNRDSCTFTAPAISHQPNVIANGGEIETVDLKSSSDDTGILKCV